MIWEVGVRVLNLDGSRNELTWSSSIVINLINIAPNTAT